MPSVAAHIETKVAQRSKFQMQSYTAEMFLPLQGHVIEFERPGDASGVSSRRVRLELLEVRKSNTGPRPEGFREMFALLFALRSPEHLGRGLHRIAHDDFEPSDWLITRVLVPGGDPSLAYYEAVFG